MDIMRRTVLNRPASAHFNRPRRQPSACPAAICPASKRRLAVLSIAAMASPMSLPTCAAGLPAFSRIKMNKRDEHNAHPHNSYAFTRALDAQRLADTVICL